MLAVWIFLTLMTLLIPLTMLVVGLVFLRRPPRQINEAFGYRTAMSTKNSDTWAFAHRFCGRLWLWLGAAMLPLSILPLLLLRKADIDTLGTASLIITGLQIAVMLLSLIPTERALRRTFDRYGLRK